MTFELDLYNDQTRIEREDAERALEQYEEFIERIQPTPDTRHPTPNPTCGQCLHFRHELSICTKHREMYWTETGSYTAFLDRQHSDRPCPKYEEFCPF